MSFNLRSTKHKFTHIKNPKLFEIIGKGGKNSYPLPPENGGKPLLRQVEQQGMMPSMNASRLRLEQHLSCIYQW